MKLQAEGKLPERTQGSVEVVVLEQLDSRPLVQHPGCPFSIDLIEL